MNRLRAVLNPTEEPAQWPLVAFIIGGSGLGLACATAAGWGRSAVFTAVAGALVAGVVASAPQRGAARLAGLTAVAVFVAIFLAAVTTGRPWWAAAAMALVALATSALAAAGPVGGAVATLATLAYAATAAIALLEDLDAGVSAAAIALRVAVGCLAGAAVAVGADRLGRRRGSGDGPPLIPAPWGAMWASLSGLDAYARDGLRRAVALAPGMYLLQHNGSRDALWIFLGAFALLITPAKVAINTALVRLGGTVVGVLLLGLLALVVSVDVLLLLGGLALLPGIAYFRRYPVAAGGLLAMAAIVAAGAPSDQIGTWATRRLWDTLLGCTLALGAQYLLWPRDTPAHVHPDNAEVALI